MSKMKLVKRIAAMAICLLMIFCNLAFTLAVNFGVSEVVLAFLEEQGINVPSNGMIELVPIEKKVVSQSNVLSGKSNFMSESGYALRIIEQDGNEIFVHHFLFLIEDENGECVIDSERAKSLMRSDDPNPGGTASLGSIIVQATTSYSTYVIPTVATAYRPTGITWAYSGSSTGVSYINVEYSTSGTAYNYSTYAKVQDGYFHQIRCSASAPLANQPYSNFNNPSPYAIDIATGGGMTVDYYATINGRSYFING